MPSDGADGAFSTHNILLFVFIRSRSSQAIQAHELETGRWPRTNRVAGGVSIVSKVTSV